MIAQKIFDFLDGSALPDDSLRGWLFWEKDGSSSLMKDGLNSWSLDDSLCGWLTIGDCGGLIGSADGVCVWSVKGGGSWGDGW